MSRVPTVGHVTPPSPTGRWAHVRLSPPSSFLLSGCVAPLNRTTSETRSSPLPLLRQVGGGEAGTVSVVTRVTAKGSMVNFEMKVVVDPGVCDGDRWAASRQARSRWTT